MQVSNSLKEKSFAYTGEKENLEMRRDEIGELMEIIAYCKNEAVSEPLVCQDTLWETYVQDGVTFADWLYCREGDGSEEDRRRLMEALDKREIVLSGPDGWSGEKAGMKEIPVALGEFPMCVAKVQDYIRKRRDILASIRDVREYEAFMQSCFTDSCFADGILSEMKHIQNFSDKTREITDAMGILNDYAVDLYRQHSGHLEEAMDILSALLRRKCAPDPAHAADLVFSFTYSEQLEGKNVAKVKDVECSPHLKLIHPGSNLRIYFYWCDKDIGAGEQVLVGRIGRHPY